MTVSRSASNGSRRAGGEPAPGRARPRPRGLGPGSGLRRAFALCALLLSSSAAGPAAAIEFEDLAGHLSVGASQLLRRSGPGAPPPEVSLPGGSLSVEGGLDLPVGASLRAGASVGYALLGTQVFERGSLAAQVDYSVFEVLALVHWTPAWRGPLGRVSAGPGLFHVRADLTTPGPAAFRDLAVEQTVGGAALGLSLISRRPAPVRVGLELGLRVLALERETWSMGSARLCFHY